MLIDFGQNLPLTRRKVCSEERSTSSDFLSVEIVWLSFSVCKWFSLAWANKGVNVPIILFASALSASVNSETKGNIQHKAKINPF